MMESTIQDWTECQVLLKYNHGTLFQEICDIDGTPIHTLEIPAGMKMARSSYEVLLRYVLLDVVAAA
jgi:hypothetical protein